MHIRNRRPTPEEVDCRYCTEYFPNVGCEAFRFIVNAVIIAKHGVETLNITKTTTIKDTETEE